MKSALLALLVLLAALPASAQRTTAVTPRVSPETVSPEVVRASGDMRPILTLPEFTVEQALRVRDARRAERRVTGRDPMPALVAAFDARMQGREQTADAAMEAALAVLHRHGHLAGHTQAEIDLAVFDLILEASSDDLATVGEDAQLANVDMQNMLQKQQQTLQMLSNMSKTMHETAKAMIQNMKG